MTTATPPTASSPDADDDLDGGLSEIVAAHSARVRPQRARRSVWWRVGYPAAFVLLALAIPALVWVGLRVILDSTDGQLVSRVTDPAAPGYEAVVDPTPTNLVVSVDADGKLDSLSLLALTSDGVGGVITIPAGTVVPIDTADLSLRFIHDNLGLDATRESAGKLLNLNFTDAQVVKSTDWAGLVGPSAPITVNSPDPVLGPDGAVLFPRGSLQLTAAQVWPYLSGRGPDESDLNRLLRTEAFWRAWLAAIADKAPSALTLPTDAGLGRFLAALGSDQAQVQTLPVTPAKVDPLGNAQFELAPADVARTLSEFIPFPEGAPGSRPRLRVLDGTGRLDNGVSAAIELNAAGAEVDVVGNARSFGATTTQLVYYDPAFERAARDLRDALGVGEVVFSEQTNSATDLTVVLGDDYLAVAGDGPGRASASGGANGEAGSGG